MKKQSNPEPPEVRPPAPPGPSASEESFEEVKYPEFLVVFCIRKGFDDFTVMGVFSKSEDAYKLQADLKNKPRVQEGSVVVTSMAMELVLDHLIRDRLGVLSHILIPLLTKASDGN